MAKKKGKGKGFEVPGFLKKRPADEVQSSSGGGSAVATAPNKRKSTPILHETVFETVASKCRKNKLFVVKRDGEDMFVGIYLNLDDIGGLSAKSKDESKGSMVSEINNGNITVMFNSDLESQNGLIFIPDKTTLDHMYEYTLLREGCQYTLVLIDVQGDGDFEKTDVKVTLDVLKKHHEKKQTIASKLTAYLEDVVEESQDLSNYSAPQPAAPAPVYQDEDDGDEDISGVNFSKGVNLVKEPVGEFAPEPDIESGSDLPFMEEPDYDNEFSGEDRVGDGFGGDFGDGDDGGYGDGDDEDTYGGSDSYDSRFDEGEHEVDYTIARRAVSRKFFNEDLDVELDTSALDQALAVYAEFRPIPYRPSGSWLSDVLNPLIANANQELFELHKQHLSEIQIDFLNRLESAYLEQMSKMNSQEIQSVLDDFQKRYNANADKLPAILAKKQEEAKADWERQIKEAGEAARVAAEQTFKDRHRAQFEEQYRNIATELQGALDAQFAAKRGDYLSGQKKALLGSVDLQVRDLVASCVEAYKAKLPAEQELLRHHEAIIRGQLDANRDAELSRIRVLDDELKRDTKLSEMAAEYNAKIQSISADFEARIAGLQSDIDTQYQRHQAELHSKDREYTSLQNQYNRDRDSWNSRVNELLTQIKEANDSKAHEVEMRVSEMRAERDSYSQKYEHLQKTQKHGYMMMVAITIVAVIAAIVVGLLIGMNMGDKDKSDVPDRPAISDTQEPGESDVQTDPIDVGGQQSSVDDAGSGGDTGSGGGDVSQPVVTNPDSGGGGDDVPNWEDLQDPPLEIT